MTVPYLPLVKAFVFFHFVAFKNIFENGLLYEKTAWLFSIGHNLHLHLHYATVNTWLVQ